MIKHQTQPTSDTCVATCVAMLANVHVSVVLNRLAERGLSLADPLHYFNILELMHSFDIVAIPLNHLTMPYANEVYIASVRSLKDPGWNHQIIVDYKNDLLFDPAKGRVDERGYPSRYYVLSDEDIEDHCGVVLLNADFSFRVLDCPAFHNI